MSNSMPGVDVFEMELFTAMLRYCCASLGGERFVYEKDSYAQGEVRFSERYQQ